MTADDDDLIQGRLSVVEIHISIFRGRLLKPSGLPATKNFNGTIFEQLKARIHATGDAHEDFTQALFTPEELIH